MYPLICHVNLCGTVLDTAALRETHARDVHGFPSCTKCVNKRYTNVNLFEQHLNTMHLKERCGYPNCTAEFWAADELHHASTKHGYPGCLVCRKISKTVKMFNKHNLGCADPVIVCGLCSESLPQSEMKEHALTHGYPECPYCKTVVRGGNESNFYAHVKSCNQSMGDMIVCSLCAGDAVHFGEAPRFPCDKRQITEHLVAVHNFKGFECPHCDMGRASGGIFINIFVFMQHISNCEYGKNYNCLNCCKVFTSRRLYGLHRDGECVPVGEMGLSFMAYAKRLHGSEMNMVCGNSHLKVKWDLSHYVSFLPPLPIPAHRAGLPLHMETEEERIFRETRRGGGNAEGKIDESGALTGCEGGAFSMSEDPRLFQQVPTMSTSHAWLFRLCGTPWELGGGKTSSLMMDQRLCLVDYFTKRSAYDVWIYLVSRFCKYTKTMYEVNEVKGLLTSCELPKGVSCQYRDLDFVRIFSSTATMNAEKERVAVKYGTRGGAQRSVMTEVSKLACKRKRVVFFETNLPVELPAVDEHDVKTMLQRNINFERYLAPALVTEVETDEGVEDLSTVVTILANPTTVLTDGDGGVPVDCVQLAETGSPSGPASIVNAVRAALYALPPHEYASHVFSVCESGEWSEICWEMIYMVYRDFITYFVKTQSFARLRLFSNFTNDSPRFVNLEELLCKFRPFIVRDMKMSSMCNRASALFYCLQAEYCCLRNLFRNGIRTTPLRASNLIEYEENRHGFLTKSVHRSMRRRIDKSEIDIH